ncbi:MAG: HyaD/HybD family hydrogenase maturation endopeptidase [Pseudomonadota bacterium]
MQILPFIQQDPLLQGNHVNPVLVLGLGNILLQDEGIGVRVVQKLQHDFLMPAQVEVLDGGTAGMALYEHVIDRTHLIVIDAVKTGRPPGSIIILEDEEVPAFFHNKISPHQLALSDILAALLIEGKPLPEITLIGIEPVRLKTGIDLSECVLAKLDLLIEMTVDYLSEIGFEAKPRTIH